MKRCTKTVRRKINELLRMNFDPYYRSGVTYGVGELELKCMAVTNVICGMIDDRPKKKGKKCI